MTQLFPDAPLYRERVFLRGFDFEANEGETSTVRANATAPIDINDPLHFFINVSEFSSDTPLRVYHGATLVGTIDAVGVFDVEHVAVSNADYFEFVAGDQGTQGFTIKASWPSVTR